MANTQNFRTAFSGFNREDVVRFIESMHKSYKTTESELREEIARLEKNLEEARTAVSDGAELKACQEALAAKEAECAQKYSDYEHQIAELRQQITAQQGNHQEPSHDLEQQELEIYRRAERTERLAKERVNQMYMAANEIFQNLQARMSDHSQEISKMAEEVSEKLSSLQNVLDGSAQIAESAAEALKSMELNQE